MTVETRLKSLVDRLKAARALPKFMDFSKVGPRYWCSSYDSRPQTVISENVFTGFSFDKETAAMKSLVERIERLAAIEGAAAGRSSCRTHRTDGFAAYPRGDITGQARVNAFEEAVERYVWSSWWDRPEIAVQVLADSEFGLEGDEFDSVAEMKHGTGVSKLHVLAPRIESEAGKSVLIIFGELPSGGFVSGGACGPIGKERATFLRAMDELYRHGLALSRLRDQKKEPVGFYERRLSFFGLGKGDYLVRDRLSRQGDHVLRLPRLVLDEEIPHSLSEIVEVHRCLFEEQPPFVGGALERLCL